MDQPSTEHRVRVRVFVDFWNFDELDEKVQVEGQLTRP